MSSVRSGNEGALLEQLKIDHSFVRDVLTNRNDMAIARSIVALAHSLSLSVMPRGVETAPQGDSLANNERYAYQEDYLFGRTVPIAALNSYLLSSPSLH